jgi:hypothetical protein
VEELLEHRNSVVMEGPPAVEAVCFAQDSGIVISILTTLPPLELFHMFKVFYSLGSADLCNRA